MEKSKFDRVIWYNPHEMNSFERAQVTCGGVDVSEINGESLESKKCSKVFLAGEIINVDGICGGIIFNGLGQVDLLQEGVLHRMQYEIEKKWLIINALYEHSVVEFFESYIPSKKIRHLLIQNKWMLIDSNPARRDDILTGKQLRIRIYDEYIVDKPKKYADIQIVYEDPFLIVVNKPAGISVHSSGNDALTLQDCVNYYFWKNNKLGAPLPIHRLDKDTTGLVMFSKSIIFQPLFDALVSQKKIERQYLAFIKAQIVANRSYLFTNPIGKDRYDSNKRVVCKNGKRAITEVYSLGTNGKISILNCKLQTGKTHQIRVHLSYHNMPIINDSLYGVSSNELSCMGLFGNHISFFHPLLNKNIDLWLSLERECKELLTLVLS